LGPLRLHWSEWSEGSLSGRRCLFDKTNIGLSVIAKDRGCRVYFEGTLWIFEFLDDFVVGSRLG
jgi:hypothetical protein